MKFSRVELSLVYHGASAPKLYRKYRKRHVYVGISTAPKQCDYAMQGNKSLTSSAPKLYRMYRRRHVYVGISTAPKQCDYAMQGNKSLTYT